MPLPHSLRSAFENEISIAFVKRKPWLTYEESVKRLTFTLKVSIG